MAEARLGFEVPISGYVIAEDRSMAARAEKAWRKARYLNLRAAVHARRLGRRMRKNSVFLSERASLCRTEIRSNALWRVGVGLISRIGASVALVRHCFSRNEAIKIAVAHKISRVHKSPGRMGFFVVGVVVSAFAAALFVPERVEPVQSALAAALPEPQPVVVAERNLSAPPPFAPASLSNAPAQWQPLRKPMAMFHLESSALAGMELNYRVSMRGTSRQDSLIWAPKAEASSEPRRAMAQIIVERHEGSQSTERPLFADLATRAAEQHLVIERMARPQDIRTKFGHIEAAETTILQHGKALSCIGFRRIDMAGLTLVGWACGAANRPVDRVALACFIDRLDLVGGGRDAGLRKMFAEAERARIPCASSRQSGKRLTWLDHEAPMPDLKLSARVR